MSDYVTWETAQAMVQEGVAAALRRLGPPGVVPGVVVTVDAGECLVEPDDAPGTVVQATRMHPDIVAGSRVKLHWPSPAAADAYGPIPQS